VGSCRPPSQPWHNRRDTSPTCSTLQRVAPNARPDMNGPLHPARTWRGRRYGPRCERVRIFPLSNLRTLPGSSKRFRLFPHETPILFCSCTHRSVILSTSLVSSQWPVVAGPWPPRPAKHTPPQDSTGVATRAYLLQLMALAYAPFAVLQLNGYQRFVLRSKYGCLEPRMTLRVRELRPPIIARKRGPPCPNDPRLYARRCLAVVQRPLERPDTWLGPPGRSQIAGWRTVNTGR